MAHYSEQAAYAMSRQDVCWATSESLPGLLPWQTYFLAFVVGVFGVRFPVPALTALLILYVADALLRSRACRLSVIAVVCCAVFGFGYATQRTPGPVPEVPNWIESRTSVDVRAVVDRADPRPFGRLRVILRDVRYNMNNGVDRLDGMVAWTLRNSKYTPEPGQIVRARLRVLPVRGFGNPGSWDYQWYWQRQGVYWRAWLDYGTRPEWGEKPGGFLWRVKSGLRRVVAEQVPDTQGGAMVLALVAGDRSRLDRTTMLATRSGGLAHTLALSGLHVGFVAALGLGLAWLAGLVYPPLLLSVPRPKLAVMLAAPLVLAYAWLGQPSASLVRAAVMFGFWGVLLLQGRGRVLMDGLFFALAAIVFVSPLSVFDLSLQMSAVAVAGIGLLYPRFRFLFANRRSWWRSILGWAAGLLCISLCANVTLLPLISWYFGTFSPNMLLNLLWLPALGFVVMPLGLAGMIVSAAGWEAGGVLLGWASHVMDSLLSILFLASEHGLTPVFSVLRPLWPEILGFALLLVAALVAISGRNRRVGGLAGCGLLLLVLPHLTVMASDTRDQTRLTLIDVGLGQAALISLPGGHRWLVDGGGGSSTFDMGEAVVAPYLTHGRPPRLDGVFMGHPDADHSHGLPFILSRFKTGPFFTNGAKPKGKTGKRMKAVLADRAMKPVALQSGRKLFLTADTWLEILHPQTGFPAARTNESSLVMRLVRRGKPLALIPGDVEQKGVDAVLAGWPDVSAEVLVLPHHGSRSSHSPAFYAAVSPEVALCSNGYLNRYGFPSSDVVRDVGVPVFTTSEHGLISVRWDGQGELSVRGFLQ